MEYDVVIIGSGLSGLQCAHLLSQEGMSVCVLEKNDRIGGMMQSFVRDGVVFNTGLNYTESLGEGEVLDKYFNLFGIKGNITLKQLDLNQSELVSIGDKEFALPQGVENYTAALMQYFPSEVKGIKQYMDVLHKVCHSFPLYDLHPDTNTFTTESPYTAQSASAFINSITSNRDLQAVLGGINILYAGQQDVTALYTHALINYSFIKSSWRIKEGGSGIANVLANGVKANGGAVIRKAEVIKLDVDKGQITSIHLKNGEQLKGKNVISSLHPKTLLPLLPDDAFKKVFKKRIQNQEDSIGMFSVYITLKKKAIKYQNYNHHYFRSDEVWTTNHQQWPQNCLLYTVYNHQTTDYANGVCIIAYMKYSEVSQWANTSIENRGDDYLAFKQEKAEQLINMAEQKMPGLKSHMVSYYTSTPLTYRDYTGSYNGSAYGVVKDYKNPMYSIITPQSRIKNLLFTGQNLNMHGILGVSISSFFTCAHFLGEKYLYKKLTKE
ncbi:NAD(P)/FAD-dependent oxidoreductase [Carboxylicivirga sp. A043]|uniref:phytoene desaturase family protein n=1 Tax=Carboxylicivirga litoralis TaxID=2816963 RepID=UPI0021CB787F|nr:NAD(P)/FAD-dependent oxidoreductase [Carboxylicivirga sp. A043]MCU4154362.1 NAD(P)/FAD-dependent oxidoreductase [Carboxylicivirga sp. A043]